jgi:hypothetical protein
VLGKKPTSHALGMEVSEQWQSFKTKNYRLEQTQQEYQIHAPKHRSW